MIDSTHPVGSDLGAGPREPMSDEQFRRIADFVESATGISMPDHKRQLVQARLGKRVRTLGLGFDEYILRAFHSADGPEERRIIIDAVTTNKTEFFREPDHFDLLRSMVLPVLSSQSPAWSPQRPLVVWSAGCASGEEPYSIAMTIAEYGLVHGPVPCVVYGTDICEEALHRAAIGIYDSHSVEAMSPILLHRYVLRSLDRRQAEVRMAPHIRDVTHFRRANLLFDAAPFPGEVDIVFCRNVLIYFDRPTQRDVLTRLAAALRTGGYLFVGHSETLNGLDLPLKSCAPTVYRRVA